uniref:Innexin n=1 Tax=Panagrellus redivivus TaxID=6233 RepID=A0A7E4VMZ5_PANRE
MSSQLGAISSVNNLIGRIFKQPRGDFVERLNSLYTVCVLSISAGLLLTSAFWGDPITCWIPAEFPKIWSDFVNQFCYAQGTYFYNIEGELTFDKEERQKYFIRYYQWIPYVIALQAFLYFIPRFLMRIVCAWSGYDVPTTIQYIDDLWHQIKSSNFPNRLDTFENVGAVYIWDGLKLFHKRQRGGLTFYYVMYTIIQCVNAWLQFLFMNQLIASSNDSVSGLTVINDLITGADWEETGHFPRITHCDFKRRKTSAIQMDTVLCVLNLNIYYEKVLVFLWFWMFFVAVVSTLHCVYWLALSICLNSYIRQQLHHKLAIHSKSANLNKFFNVLGNDGIFILHQVGVNIGELPASYLAQAMFNVADELDNRGETASLLEKGMKTA